MMIFAASEIDAIGLSALWTAIITAIGLAAVQIIVALGGQLILYIRELAKIERENVMAGHVADVAARQVEATREVTTVKTVLQDLTAEQNLKLDRVAEHVADVAKSANGMSTKMAAENRELGEVIGAERERMKHVEIDAAVSAAQQAQPSATP